MRPSELQAIVTELMRQKELENIVDQYNHWAFIAAMIANASSSICGTLVHKKGKQFKPEDYINKKALAKMKAAGQEARPQKGLASLIEEAKAKGLKGPW